MKSSATIDNKDLNGLRALREAAGKWFVRGVVCYTGTEVVPFERNLHAVPVSALWSKDSYSAI